MSVRTDTKTQVLFNKPLVSVVLPPDVGVNKSNLNPTYKEITEIVAACKEAGYTVNSIVVRRDLYKWGCTDSAKWGVVSNIKSYRGTGDYYPLAVTWFNTKDGDTLEWPSSLYLIREAENPQDIFERIKAQSD